MNDIAIKIEGVGKSYTIGKQKDSSFRSALEKVLKPSISKGEDFWALKNVSFTVEKGEVIGIIGKNGAGKSTLLKILSQITRPSEGRIEINGRVASLLEVGTGFHPELTGRENIFLNGTILGMTRKEVRAKFDEIVQFSGVQKFIDTPVKHYSSGMYVRLAFAVAAHLEPEILIIDEVLAVGDAEFQKKCLGKMQDVAEYGRTVLFVSDNTSALKAICNNGILIESGKVKYVGSIDDTIKKYLSNESSRFVQELNVNSHPRQSGIQDLRISKKFFDKASYQSKDDIEIKIFLDSEKEIDFLNIKLGILVHDEYGNKVYHISNIYKDEVVPKHETGKQYVFRINQNSLSAGVYQLHVWLGANEEEQDLITEGISIEIMDGNIYDFPNSSMIHGVVQPTFSFHTNKNT